MTGDADLSWEFCVLVSSRLIDELRADGYQLVARNRLERDGGTRAIDVLVPAGIFRVRHNRAVGELFVDEAPGLRYALSRAPLILELQVRASLRWKRAGPLEGIAARTEPARSQTHPAASAAACQAVGRRVRQRNRDMTRGR